MGSVHIWAICVWVLGQQAAGDSAVRQVIKEVRHCLHENLESCVLDYARGAIVEAAHSDGLTIGVTNGRSLDDLEDVLARKLVSVIGVPESAEFIETARKKSLMRNLQVEEGGENMTIMDNDENSCGSRAFTRMVNSTRQVSILPDMGAQNVANSYNNQKVFVTIIRTCPPRRSLLPIYAKLAFHQAWKYIIPFLIGVKLKLATFVPMVMVALTLLANSAMFAGKLAMFFSVLNVALKYMYPKWSQDQQTYPEQQHQGYGDVANPYLGHQQYPAPQEGQYGQQFSQQFGHGQPISQQYGQQFGQQFGQQYAKPQRRRVVVEYH